MVSEGIYGKRIDIFSLSRWVNSFFSASLATNFISTGLLALRIWQVYRKTGGCSGPISETVLYRFGRVLVDSGMLYSVTLLIALILYVCKSNVQYIVIDSVRYSHSSFPSLAINDRHDSYIFFLL
jgi:hypothetical protein